MSNEEVTAEDMAEDAEMKMVGLDSSASPDELSASQVQAWRHIALIWRTIGELSGEAPGQLNVDDIFMNVCNSLAEKVLAGGQIDDEMKTLAVAIKVSVDRTRAYSEEIDDEEDGDEDTEESEAS